MALTPATARAVPTFTDIKLPQTPPLVPAKDLKSVSAQYDSSHMAFGRRGLTRMSDCFTNPNTLISPSDAEKGRGNATVQSCVLDVHSLRRRVEISSWSVFKFCMSGEKDAHILLETGVGNRRDQA
jgi:hypothetical protein